MMANNAFDNMNNIDPDMSITGGSLFMSEYEQNMTPQDQDKFEQLLLDRFLMAYESDPHKGTLDFKHWLKTVRPDLLAERAQKWEEEREDVRTWSMGDVWEGMDPSAETWIPEYGVSDEEFTILEDAGLIQRLAHLHTGRIEDLIPIVDNLPAANIASPQISPFQETPFRGPEEPQDEIQVEQLPVQ